LVTRLWDTYLAEGDALPDFLVYVFASFLLTVSQLTLDFSPKQVIWITFHSVAKMPRGSICWFIFVRLSPYWYIAVGNGNYDFHFCLPENTCLWQHFYAVRNPFRSYCAF